MRFLLDNDVDAGVAKVLRARGHDVVTAHGVGLAGDDAAPDDALTAYADDKGRVLVTHDREFTYRRKRNTIGQHVRLRCDHPDAAELVADKHDEIIEALGWTETAVIEVSRSRVNHSPPRWE